MTSLFNRYEKNPILSSRANGWEDLGVFNAAAIKRDRKYELIYRAVGKNKISKLGYAQSIDGFRWQRNDEPLLSPEDGKADESLGMEDPRLTYLDNQYYLIYVGASLYGKDHPCPPWAPDKPWRVRLMMTRTKDLQTFEKHQVILANQDTKDPALFPKRFNNNLYLIHRIFPHIWLNIGSQFGKWDKSQILFQTRPGMWDGNRIGAGPPPIQIKEGWLLIYHGVDEQLNYRLGAVLLDKDDPTKILARSKVPFLSPEESYERQGRVANAIFSCGVIQEDDHLIVYYGAGDRVLCAGTIKINDLLNTLEAVK